MLGEQVEMVSDAMSDVVLAVGPGHTLRQAAEKMAERGVGSAIVMDPEAMGPGVVAERDIVRAVAAGLDLDKEFVTNHMARDTVVAVPSWPLEQAAQMMMKGRCRHLVVVDGNEVVGVVSIRDIVAAWEPIATAVHQSAQATA
ncbi:MAG: CBS domain-containing protein [Solirubrobacteraceae bacterium]|nr:CBS domain-containing protein [Solirubrobacteraceae bacterium]